MGEDIDRSGRTDGIQSSCRRFDNCPGSEEQGTIVRSKGDRIEQFVSMLDREFHR